MKKPIVLFGCLLSLLLPSLSSAERHAVLVGIADYPVIQTLQGPVNDVRLMKATLIKHWGFKSSLITSLVNHQARKNAILSAIRSLEQRAQAGDDIFIYLSGHGTSAADPRVGLSLPSDTAAFIPFDIEGLKSASKLYEHLLIGQRDLQPILKRFDQRGFKTFVTIDACFSANAFRAKPNDEPLPSRFVSFSRILRPQTKAKLAKPSAEPHSKPSGYPYQYVFSFSAARANETAKDIPANMLTKYPTVDNRAHGAFTDSLVRVLSRQTNGDRNGDKVLSYGELVLAVQDLMRRRGFSSTPIAQPKSPEDINHLARRELFGLAKPY